MSPCGICGVHLKSMGEVKYTSPYLYSFITNARTTIEERDASRALSICKFFYFYFICFIYIYYYISLATYNFDGHNDRRPPPNKGRRLAQGTAEERDRVGEHKWQGLKMRRVSSPGMFLFCFFLYTFLMIN
jgi:hypothetical protein